MGAWFEHLQEQTETGEKYYKIVNDNVLQETKSKIVNIINEGYDNNILSQEEYMAMMPEEAVP